MKRKSIEPTDDFQKKSKQEALFQVYCRVRPLPSGEATGLYEWTSSGLTISNTETYTFTNVFPPDSQQEHVFELVGKPAVSSLLHYRDSLIFAYGITSSGKTHTIQGTKEAPGLIPRVLHLLHQQNTLGLSASYYEIYNDRIFDLLNNRAQVRLLQDDSATRLSDLTISPFTDFTQAEALLNAGMRSRKVSETALNEVSSRSHSVFVIWLKTLHGAAQLAIVDLAGAERATRTETMGDRLKEARAINSSLSVLGRCLSALKSNHRSEAPYRESKLTQVLRDFFISSDPHITLILNLNPRLSDVDETRSALKFAAMAAEITIKSTRETLSKPDYKPNNCEIDSIRKELIEANRRIEQLEAILKEKNDRDAECRTEIVASMTSLLTEMELAYRANLHIVEQSYEEIVSAQGELLTRFTRVRSQSVPCQSTNSSVSMAQEGGQEKKRRKNKEMRTPASPIASRTRQKLKLADN